MDLILVGIISGIITGLGMGGGSLLILILGSYFSISQHVAQATNLVYYIPASIIAILIHIKNKNVEKEVGKKLFVVTIIGSALGAYLTTFIDSSGLKKYFGFFLFVIGIYEFITTIKIHSREKRKGKEE